MLHIDTQIFAALHDGEPVSTDRRARRLIGSEPVFVSPLVLFEIELIKHRTRIASALEALAAVKATFGVEVAHSPLSAIAERAMTLDWTREPMDRLIVAHAMVDGACLITRDERIRANFTDALW